jgi:hypothetical protein
MSAPDGDLERQAKHHRGPLRGMFAVVLFALVLLAILGFWAFGRGGDPQGAATQVQEGTGEVESGEANDAITANDMADEEQGAGTGGAADPSAVTVAPETVTAPQVGTGSPPDTDPGESQSAEPLDPVDDAAEGSAEQAETESENE